MSSPRAETISRRPSSLSHRTVAPASSAHSPMGAKSTSSVIWAAGPLSRGRPPTTMPTILSANPGLQRLNAHSQGTQCPRRHRFIGSPALFSASSCAVIQCCESDGRTTRQTGRSPRSPQSHAAPAGLRQQAAGTRLRRPHKQNAGAGRHCMNHGGGGGN